MNDLTVMVTAAGNQYMLGLADCLKNNGERNIRIVGTDMNNDPTILQMMDKMYQVPSATSSDYIEKLIEICKKEKVDILIPVMSAELPALVKYKTKFEEIGTKVSISNSESIYITNNKFRLYRFMRDNGMYVPKFCSINNVNELDNAFKKVGYPNNAVCIKATELSGSRGIRIIDPNKTRSDILLGEKPNSFYISYDELKNILSERITFPEMMVMEALPGKEFSVDLVADNGTILYMAARKSNSIIASIPMDATIFHEPEAYNICRKLIKLLNFDGNADFDFKYDKNNKPVLMEINPRVAATMAIFKYGGMNLPYLRIKQLMGEKLPEINIKIGINMKRRYLEMFSNVK
jgi:carbamoyl-phosphate synthase large subunit